MEETEGTEETGTEATGGTDRASTQRRGDTEKGHNCQLTTGQADAAACAAADGLTCRELKP